MLKGESQQNTSSQTLDEICTSFKEVKKKFFDGLIAESNLKSELRKRKSTYLFEGILNELIDKYLSEGWEIEKKYKTKTKIKQIKPFDIAFEDEVWATIASLDFHCMNKNRHLKIPYSEDLALTQQIDVFAADKETILIIECKSTDGERKKGNFKEAIEAIGGKKDGILKAIKKLFPESKHKVKFIFATKNYVLSAPDQERLENFDIIHFDEEVIK
jgi:DNA sulfur modification protein DndB